MWTNWYVPAIHHTVHLIHSRTSVQQVRFLTRGLKNRTGKGHPKNPGRRLVEIAKRLHLSSVPGVEGVKVRRGGVLY